VTPGETQPTSRCRSRNLKPSHTADLKSSCRPPALRTTNTLQRGLLKAELVSGRSLWPVTRGFPKPSTQNRTHRERREQAGWTKRVFRSARPGVTLWGQDAAYDASVDSS
jgi:hypothetical protein